MKPDLRPALAAILVAATLPGFTLQSAQAQAPLPDELHLVETPVESLTHEVGNLLVANDSPAIKVLQQVQAVCDRVDFLRVPFAATDSGAMQLGEVRTALFTMAATASGVPLGASAQALAWAATPYASGGLPTDALAIAVTLEPWEVIEVDLTATLHDATAQPTASQQDTIFLVASPAECGEGCPPACVPPCSDKLVQEDGSVEERVEDYTACPSQPCDERLAEPGAPPENRLGNYYSCIYGEPMPASPTVRATTTIDATLPAAPSVCTGSKTPAASLTVGGSVTGGLVMEATVSASLTVNVATQYDFACDYGLFAQAYGEGGFLRKVRMELHETKTLDPLLAQFGSDDPPGARIGTPCEYTGISPQTWCETKPDSVLRDAFSGSGVAGPASGGTPAWPLPTQVRICPPTSPTLSLTAISEPVYEIPLYEVTASKAWECQDFSIHYVS